VATLRDEQPGFYSRQVSRATERLTCIRKAAGQIVGLRTDASNFFVMFLVLSGEYQNGIYKYTTTDVPLPPVHS